MTLKEFASKELATAYPLFLEVLACQDAQTGNPLSIKMLQDLSLACQAEAASIREVEKHAGLFGEHIGLWQRALAEWWKLAERRLTIQAAQAFNKYNESRNELFMATMLERADYKAMVDEILEHGISGDPSKVHAKARREFKEKMEREVAT